MNTKIHIEDIRYATNTQLQMLFGISAKKFALWATSEYSLPLNIAEKIATSNGLLMSDVLEQWSLRRCDVALRKESHSRINELIETSLNEYNRRYYQLHIKLEEVSYET